MVKVPPSGTGDRTFVLPALETMRGNKWLYSPGSVCAYPIDRARYALLACSNYAHYVSQHILDAGERLIVESNDILLSKGLNEDVAHRGASAMKAMMLHRAATVGTAARKYAVLAKIHVT